MSYPIPKSITAPDISWLLFVKVNATVGGFGLFRFFVAFIQMGVNSFKANLSDYSKGVMEFLDLIKPIFPQKIWEENEKLWSVFFFF